MLPFHAAPALDSGLCQVSYDCDSYIIPFGLFLDNQLLVQGHLLACVLRSNHHLPSFPASCCVPENEPYGYFEVILTFGAQFRRQLQAHAEGSFRWHSAPLVRRTAEEAVVEQDAVREVHLPPTHKRNVSSSPLRVSAILTAWDENGQLMGRSEQELEVNSDDSDSDEPLQTTVTCTLDEKGAHVETETSHSRSIMKVDKTRLKSLKISRGLRTIVIKLSHFYCPPRRPALRSY
ncbi:hypothetical protein PTI98_001998 [Pleurotus ostreatus]|nr:hypothetical protein PTI98_001998 [Pleurotus ostreatus]